MIYHFSTLDGIAEVAAKRTVNVIKTGKKIIIPLLPLTFSTSSTNFGAAAINDNHDDNANNKRDATGSLLARLKYKTNININNNHPTLITI